MANTPQAKKRARQTEVRRKHNASERSRFRTVVKKVVKAIDDGDYETAQSLYKTAVPVIDRAVTHGIIHRNKAARHKSHLNNKIKALSASAS